MNYCSYCHRAPKQWPFFIKVHLIGGNKSALQETAEQELWPKSFWGSTERHVSHGLAAILDESEGILIFCLGGVGERLSHVLSDH